jgi:outer membrane protein assembly factor BamB
MAHEDLVAGVGQALAMDKVSIAPGTLLTATHDGRAQALDLDTGTVRWVAHGSSVPINEGGRVALVRAVNAGGPIRALDLTSGTALWTGPQANVTPMTMIAGDVVVWYPDVQGRGAAFDARTGATRWLSQAAGGLAGGGRDWFALYAPGPQITLYEIPSAGRP